MLPSKSVDDSALLHVVLGPNREADFMGGKLRLLFLEVYAEGIAMTWRVGSVPRVHMEEPDEHGHYQSRIVDLKFVVTDDKGTQYKRGGGRASAGRHHVDGRFYCVPPIPSDATRLDVGLEDIVFSFDLTTICSKPTSWLRALADALVIVASRKRLRRHGSCTLAGIDARLCVKR
jgi:hypothetical protein